MGMAVRHDPSHHANPLRHRRLRLSTSGSRQDDRSQRCAGSLRARYRSPIPVSPRRRGSGLLAALAFVVLVAVWGTMVLAAQDKNTLQVPNGLPFSDFRGYEDWQVVSVSQTDELLKAMVANPVMIDAYKAGVPGNGKPFPDGSKIAKIEWKLKRARRPPFPSTCQTPCKTFSSSRRIPRDSRTRRGGPTPCLTTIPRPTRTRPMPPEPSIAGSRAIQ
jgi:hypothetical protein